MDSDATVRSGVDIVPAHVSPTHSTTLLSSVRSSVPYTPFGCCETASVLLASAPSCALACAASSISTAADRERTTGIPCAHKAPVHVTPSVGRWRPPRLEPPPLPPTQRPLCPQIYFLESRRCRSTVPQRVLDGTPRALLGPGGGSSGWLCAPRAHGHDQNGGWMTRVSGGDERRVLVEWIVRDI